MNNNYNNEKINNKKYSNFDLSSDNVNNNQYNRNNNYINQLNLTANDFENPFYQKNNYNIDNNNQYQRTIKKNERQFLPFQFKKNLRNKILNPTNDYYNNTDDNNNYINNNIINNYNNYNIYNNYDNYNDSSDYNNDNNYFNNNNKRKSHSISINIEDLIILEEKLNEIIFFLKTRKDVRNQCFDFWNFFYNSSLYQKIEKTFKNEKDIEIIKLSIKYELISIILCYEFSFDSKVLNKTYILLLEILELNHRNLMAICENILNKVSSDSKVNEWVLKLNEIPINN
jgi:hypothetical protein